MLTTHQATRYEILKVGITKKIKNLSNLDCYNSMINNIIIPNIQTCSLDYINNWIVGFLNGEVAFTKSTKLNKDIPIVFLEHTDQAAVNLIKSHLNIGPNVLSRTRDNRKTTYYLNISSKKDILNIVKFLNEMNNLSGQKLIQYNEWKNKFNL